jgi:hypothetical protein
VSEVLATFHEDFCTRKPLETPAVLLLHADVDMLDLGRHLMLFVLSPFIVHIIKTEKKTRFETAISTHKLVVAQRFERIVGDARKSKPASGFRQNGPHERICFASRYFILWFSPVRSCCS